MRLAKYSLSLESSCPYRLTAYYAQQCAEKYLKAFLVFHNIDIPYTHSIGRLLELASNIVNLQKLSEADTLTPFAITTCYSGEDEEVTEEEAINAIKIAESAKSIIIRNLPI